MNLFTLDADSVLAINEKVCKDGGNPIHCFDPGKIESALHTAFYPGSSSYIHGGIAKIAGALAFELMEYSGSLWKKSNPTFRRNLARHKWGGGNHLE